MKFHILKKQSNKKLTLIHFQLDWPNWKSTLYQVRGQYHSVFLHFLIIISSYTRLLYDSQLCLSSTKYCNKTSLFFLFQCLPDMCFCLIKQIKIISVAYENTIKSIELITTDSSNDHSSKRNGQNSMIWWFG